MDPSAADLDPLGRVQDLAGIREQTWQMRADAR
jgi:hypothetical protein